MSVSLVNQQTGEVLEEIDAAAAPQRVHAGAIYLHEAQSFFVKDLNLEEHIAYLKPIESDYYTEPLQGTEVTVLSETAREAVQSCDKAWGELQVTTQVTGFRKRRWYTHENLGEEPLDLPPTDLQTTGYWVSLSEETVTRLREAGAWSNDPNNYGPDWNRIRERVRARDKYTCHPALPRRDRAPPPPLARRARGCARRAPRGSG